MPSRKFKQYSFISILLAASLLAAALLNSNPILAQESEATAFSPAETPTATPTANPETVPIGEAIAELTAVPTDEPPILPTITPTTQLTSEVTPEVTLEPTVEFTLTPTSTELIKTSSQDPEAPLPLINDALELPEPMQEKIREYNLMRQTASPQSRAPGYYDTSVYMVGTVAVGIILPESTGSGENWSTARQDQVITKIQEGMNWWKSKGGSAANLNFVYDIRRSVPTSYEPIQRPQSEASLWISDTLNNMGFSGSSSHDKAYNYVNHLRAANNTKWAFAIFVADSLNDSDGIFNGSQYFAYAYLGGPYMVMTYDNDGWGIDRMNQVASHETGHIFMAADEYYAPGYGGCTSTTERYGYLGVNNGNCEYGNPASAPCIMRSNEDSLCEFTKGQIGWRDANSNGVYDPIDTFPANNFSPYQPDPTSQTSLYYEGWVYENPWPHAICGNGDWCANHDVTINTISSAQQRVDGGSWVSIPGSLSGSYDADVENLAFNTPTLTDGTHTIEIQTYNSLGRFATWTDQVTIDHLANINDDFNTPITITSEPYTNTQNIFNLTSASDDPIIPCVSSKKYKTVWYSFVPPHNGLVTVDTYGSDFYPVLAAWTGSRGALVNRACADGMSQNKIELAVTPGTTYYIEVADYYSDYWEGMLTLNLNQSEPIPAAPQLINPDNSITTTNSTPEFQWGELDYVQDYHLQISASSTFSPIRQEQTGISGLSFTAAALTDGRYYWRVRARNLEGIYGAWSAVRYFTVDSTPPAPPLLLKPGNETSFTGTPTFSWGASATAVSYQFAYGTSANPDSGNVYKSGELTGLTHKPPAMGVMTPFYWFVCARDAAGNWSSWSAPFSVTIIPPVPAKVGLASPGNNAFLPSSTPELSWNAVTYGEDYHIQISSNYTFTKFVETADGIAGTAFTPTVPLAQGKYYWRVRARNANGIFGAWSAYRAFTVDTIAPPAPILLLPADGAAREGTPAFSWKAAAGAKYYQFAYNQSGDARAGFEYVSPENITVLSFKPPAMDILTTFYWFVRAGDAAGNWSGWSAPNRITITPPKPAKVTLVSPASGYLTDLSSFEVRWNTVAYGQTYQVQVDSSAYFNKNPRIFGSEVGAASTVIGSLSAGKWYWRVRAQNVNGVFGAWSAYRNFTVFPSFNTQFDSSADYEGWEQHPGATWHVDGGTLNHSRLSYDETSSASYSKAIFKDFTYSVRMMMDAPDSYQTNRHGLVLRGTPAFSTSNDWLNGYYFELMQVNYPEWGAPDACFNVIKIVNGKRTSLTPNGYWYCDPAINYGAFNTFSVYMKGETLKFYINGSLMLSKTASGPLSGRLGVYSNGDWIDGQDMGTAVDWAASGRPVLPSNFPDPGFADDFTRSISAEALNALQASGQ